MTNLNHILTTIHKAISNSTDWFANHSGLGILGMISSFLLSIIPDGNYDQSRVHIFALMLKDVGIVCGALLSILTLVAYIWKNIIRKLFKKKNDGTIT